jgi:hypothetical protein
MRYWGLFAAKIGVAGAGMYGLLQALKYLWAPTSTFFPHKAARFGYDLHYTAAVGVWFLLTCAVFALCVLDQRYRCRVCLRRLRMPIVTGSWSRMLQFGRPRIEYICPYGHGNLSVAELQISGLENAEWRQHAELWEELVATSKNSDRHS